MSETDTRAKTDIAERYIRSTLCKEFSVHKSLPKSQKGTWAKAILCVDDFIIASYRNRKSQGCLIAISWSTKNVCWIVEDVHWLSVDCLIALPDGKHFASGGYNSWVIKVGEIATGKTIRVFERTSCTHSLAASPDGNFLITGCDKSIVVWSLTTDVNQPAHHNWTQDIVSNIEATSNDCVTFSSGQKKYKWNFINNPAVMEVVK